MKRTNHVLEHDKEIEPEGDGYADWKLKLNAAEPIAITNGKIVTFKNSTSVSIALDGDGNIIMTAQTKLFKKPDKPVEAATYVIQAGDAEKWLVFKQNCTVTVPTGLAVEDIFEGEAAPGVTVTFVAATGATIRHADSISKTLSQNSPFGIRNYMLYGTDPTNYAG